MAIATYPAAPAFLTIPRAMNPTELELRLKWLRSKLDRLRAPAGAGVNAHEHRVYSQHREDGIIRHILEFAGIHGSRCIEFGFGPCQANCLNLVLHYGFHGLFMDGNAGKCRELDRIMAKRNASVSTLNAFLTRDNLDDLIRANGFAGEIAVLSIDVDGNDYWLWDSIQCCDPALVIIEYNASFGPERSVTVPYHPNFVRYEQHESGLYHGASLAALSKLGAGKGYGLVGVDSTGVNAFFVKNDLLKADLARVSPSESFKPHRGRTKHKGMSAKTQWQAISHLPFEEV